MNLFRGRLVVPAAALTLLLNAATFGHSLAAQNTTIPGSTLTNPASPAPDYGIAAESSYYAGAPAFHAMYANVSVLYDTFSAMTSGTGTKSDAWAPVNLPQGALIGGIDLYYYDTNLAQQFYCYLVEVPTSGDPASLIVGAYAGTGGWGVTTSNLGSPVTVNNASNGYVVLVGTGLPPVTDGSIKWRGVKVRYKLQVSPAPGVASFTDVPTDYWAFQYIEALKASGITQGVTPTTYEPESNVTRAQMAVFLAKALGLHWPN